MTCLSAVMPAPRTFHRSDRLVLDLLADMVGGGVEDGLPRAIEDFSKCARHRRLRRAHQHIELGGLASGRERKQGQHLVAALNGAVVVVDGEKSDNGLELFAARLER